MTRHSRSTGAGVSRRALLSALGMSGAVAATMPDWGELRLPGLGSIGGAARAQSGIRLSSNENPYGMSSAARAALVAASEHANRYPFRWSDELGQAIAAHHGIRASELVMGAGSTEILRVCAAAWGGRGALVQASPTFETLGSYTRAFGHEVRSVPLDTEGRHDLDRMAEAIDDSVGVVYVCNPSNPSSTLVPQAELDAFIDAVPERVVVLVDEAYHDFVEAPDYVSQMERARASSNVIVIRTFSKVFGMAGLRVGYAVGPSARMRELSADLTEMSVGVVSSACATASIRDTAYPMQQKRLNSEARAILVRGLSDMGIDTWQSETNFVMAHLGRPMMPVNQAMARQGVLVGRLFPALPNHLRISMGTPEQMHRCVEALGQVL